LIADGACRRWAIDTYEQEVERFGGVDGMRAAVSLFAADSRAAVDLIELLHVKKASLDRECLAVLTVDALLDGLGLNEEARFQWCRSQVRLRHAASREYRQWKGTLRPMLADTSSLRSIRGGAEIAGILDRLRRAGAAFRAALVALESAAHLTRRPGDLHQSAIHLHLNRLLGGDAVTESRVIALLWRVREGLWRSER